LCKNSKCNWDNGVHTPSNQLRCKHWYSENETKKLQQSLELLVGNNHNGNKPYEKQFSVGNSLGRSNDPIFREIVGDDAVNLEDEEVEDVEMEFTIKSRDNVCENVFGSEINGNWSLEMFLRSC